MSDEVCTSCRADDFVPNATSTLQETFIQLIKQNARLIEQKQLLRYESDLVQDRIQELESERRKLQMRHISVKKEVSTNRLTSNSLDVANKSLKSQLATVSSSGDCGPTAAVQETENHLKEMQFVESLLTKDNFRLLQKYPETSLDSKLQGLIQHCRTSSTDNKESNNHSCDDSEESIHSLCCKFKDALSRYNTKVPRRLALGRQFEHLDEDLADVLSKTAPLTGLNTCILEESSKGGEVILVHEDPHEDSSTDSSQYNSDIDADS